jgi:hypothetical protein
VRKRYLQDQLSGYVETPCVYLLKNIHTDLIINVLLYYYLCKEERIVYEYVIDIVFEKYTKGPLRHIFSRNYRLYITVV